MQDKQVEMHKHRHRGLGHARRGTMKQQVTGIFVRRRERCEDRCALGVLCVHLMGFLAATADNQVLHAANASLQPMRRTGQCGRAGNIFTLCGTDEFQRDSIMFGGRHLG